jgi:SPP1 gp7 family putative phage head morphogenesis protein
MIQRLEVLRAGLGERAITVFSSGMKAGLGYKEIMRNIRQELAIGGSQLERLVRTEGQRISNDILFATYEKNKKNIGGIMYLATLDMRTCETCGHYDRDEYWYDGVPSVGKAPYVPLHPMCRCVYVPISREWQNKTSRASMFGPVDTDYKEWLKSAEINDPGFAKPILGKNYSAWKQGNYAPSDKLTPQITYSNYLTQTKGMRK